MKNKLPALAALVASCGFATASAQSTGQFVDAAQFQIENPIPFTLAVGGGSQQTLAQTLTVEVGGRLAGVFLPISCANGKVLVEIRDVKGDLPGTRILASQSVRAAELDAPFRFTFVEMRSKHVFTTGMQVAIVVSNASGSCGLAPAPVSVAYAGGRGSFEALPNAAGFLPFSDFPNTADDLPFQLVLD
jgi:hypothetical protein